VEAVLSIKGLRKSFGKTEVLHGLDLQVTTGAIHGLVGLNGSGKTTTMECVLGMQAFNSGELRVMGREPSQLWRGQGDVVGIFDTPGVHSGLTVRQVLEHARLLCPRPVRTPAQVEAMLGISRYSQYKIRQLSLGNRRRVSIAHALLGQPAFVVLDEPFNGLDAGGVEEVLALILRLNREEGTSFLLSSHQLAYLESICSYMSILHQGRIALSEKLDTLFAGSASRLSIHCDNAELAGALLAQLPGVTQLVIGDKQVNLTLTEGSAADINRLLVTSNIAVSELHGERPGLSRIFHDIVGSPTAAVSREAH
jgi:ABC-2 type transport system ATP-binding protein